MGVRSVNRRLLLTAQGLVLLLTFAWVAPAFASATSFVDTSLISASKHHHPPGIDLSFCAETAEGNEDEHASGVLVDCGAEQTTSRIVLSAFLSASIQPERHFLFYLTPESRGPPLH